VKRGNFTLTLVALSATLLGFVAGRMSGTKQVANHWASPVAIPAVYAAEETVLPTLDIPGADIAGLPRYPGAMRVEYRQSLEDYLLATEVEYVAAELLETVHDYYREVFRNGGWSVADLGFYQGEWTFFILDGHREAFVEIEARGALVEIEIEVREPSGRAVSAAQSRTD